MKKPGIDIEERRRRGKEFVIRQLSADLAHALREDLTFRTMVARRGWAGFSSYTPKELAQAYLDANLMPTPAQHADIEAFVRHQIAPEPAKPPVATIVETEDHSLD